MTGDDRVRWLNGMVTNSVQALTPGEGAYTFLLSAQGRIQGDATIWAEADRLLLQTSAAQVAPLLSLLDRFIIMDDVELADLTAEAHGLLIAGPNAIEALASIGLAARASKLLKRQTVIWPRAGLCPGQCVQSAGGSYRTLVQTKLTVSTPCTRRCSLPV